MLRALDYNRIESIIDIVELIDKKDFELALFEPPKGLKWNCDLKNSTIESPSLYAKLEAIGEFKIFLASDKNWISIDFFLILYSHLLAPQSPTDGRTYKRLLSQIEDDILFLTHSELQEQQRLFHLAYQLSTKNIPWSEFAQEFDPQNWTDIFLLIDVLPLSYTTIDEFLPWISEIVNKQQQDLVLGGLSSRITEWVIYGKSLKTVSDEELIAMAQWPDANKFLFAFLKGVKQKQQHQTAHYIKTLEPLMKGETHFTVLNAIGFVSKESEKDQLLLLLISRFEEHKLPANEFIRLCRNFDLYREEVYSRIDPLLIYSDNIQQLLAFIEYLLRAPDSVDKSWFIKSANFVMSLPHKELSRSLDLLLF